MKQHRILFLYVFLVAVSVALMSGHTVVADLAVSGAAYYQHWANAYHVHGGGEGHWVARVQASGDGNVIIGGTDWFDSASQGYYWMNVAEISKTGQARWGIQPLKCGDDGVARVDAVAIMADGRIAALGVYREAWDSPSSSVVLMIMSRSGALQRIKTFFDGDVYECRAYDLQPTKDGGLILAARLDRPWIAKLNSRGGIVWQRRTEGTIYSIRQTQNGGFIGAGVQGGDFGSPSSNAWLVKFNALGQVSWQRSCGEASAADGFRRVAQAGDGYVALGETQGLGASLNDITVVRFDRQGRVLWQRALGRADPGYWNSAMSLVRSSQGGFFICADQDLYRLDDLGNLVWAKSYLAHLKDITQTGQGDVVLAGELLLPNDACYPDGVDARFFFAAQLDDQGNIGQSCCLISSEDVSDRNTAADVWNPHCSFSSGKVWVGSLSPTDVGLKSVDVLGLCQADWQ